MQHLHHHTRGARTEHHLVLGHAFVRRDQSAQPWHQLSVLIVDGPAPALEQLGLLIEQRIAYSPRFRQKLAGTGLQSWIDDRGFRVGGHLRAERVTARLEDRLAALLAERPEASGR